MRQLLRFMLRQQGREQDTICVHQLANANKTARKQCHAHNDQLSGEQEGSRQVHNGFGQVPDVLHMVLLIYSCDASILFGVMLPVFQEGDTL